MRADAQQRDAIEILHLHLADIQLHDLRHNPQVGIGLRGTLR